MFVIDWTSIISVKKEKKKKKDGLEDDIYGAWMATELGIIDLKDLVQTPLIP